MQAQDPSLWGHSHDYGTAAQWRAEGRTRAVVALTLGFMVVELVAGWLTGSMALLADGWHMGSHAAALGIAAYAYAFARRHRADPRFSFGTGKVSPLAGYSSALLLGAGALWMLVESLSRLLEPVSIHYGEALLVAALGLGVNLVSAWLLGHEHQGPGHAQDHDHRHGHHHDHESGHEQDHNLRAAYLHVGGGQSLPAARLHQHRLADLRARAACLGPRLWCLPRSPGFAGAQRLGLVARANAPATDHSHHRRPGPPTDATG